LARQKDLRIVSSLDTTVGMLQADARRLKQMLVNLLSNAVKFTPEGGTIGLDVVGDAAAQRIHMTIWDTGIGMAADDLPRLFQPFVQLDSRLARQYNGTGLGLALVQRMAALHGGSVAVASTLGQGSRFTITLPWIAAVPVSYSASATELSTRFGDQQ
jgi:signal transduction histidine kinase